MISPGLRIALLAAVGCATHTAHVAPPWQADPSPSTFADPPRCPSFPLDPDGLSFDLHVRDTSGAPIATARMVLTNDQYASRVVADRNGLARIAGIPRGLYRVWVGADGFAGWYASVLIVERATSRDVELTPAAAVYQDYDIEGTMLMDDCTDEGKPLDWKPAWKPLK